MSGAATDTIWRVNVWDHGAWAPWSGGSGDVRLSGHARDLDSEYHARREADRLAARGTVARLSRFTEVVAHFNLDRLDKAEANLAFADDRIRGAAFPCAVCTGLTTFVPLPGGSGLYSGRRLCGGDRCAAAFEETMDELFPVEDDA